MMGELIRLCVQFGVGEFLPTADYSNLVAVGHCLLCHEIMQRRIPRILDRGVIPAFQ